MKQCCCMVHWLYVRTIKAQLNRETVRTQLIENTLYGNTFSHTFHVYLFFFLFQLIIRFDTASNEINLLQWQVFSQVGNPSPLQLLCNLTTARMYIIKIKDVAEKFCLYRVSLRLYPASAKWFLRIRNRTLRWILTTIYTLCNFSSDENKSVKNCKYFLYGTIPYHLLVQIRTYICVISACAT